MLIFSAYYPQLFLMRTIWFFLLLYRVPSRHYQYYPLDKIKPAKYDRIPINLDSSLQLEGNSGIIVSGYTYTDTKPKTTINTKDPSRTTIFSWESPSQIHRVSRHFHQWDRSGGSFASWAVKEDKTGLLRGDHVHGWTFWTDIGYD